MRFAVDARDTFAYTGSRPFDPARPSIVFVHGAGLDHTVWILQSRYFAHHGYNAVALDLPGHGRSSGDLLPSISAMADWVASALDALEIETAFLAGHSMGALVVLETAATHRERVRASALLGIAVPMVVADPLLNAAKANDHAAIDMITLWGHRTGAQIGGNQSPGMWMTGSGVRLLERAGPGVLYSDLNACNEYRHGLESAARVTCPAHLILGKQDIMAPPRAARELVSALSVVHMKEIESCGHMLMSEQPDAVLDALIEVFAPAR